jgi:hypothetical protein
MNQQKKIKIQYLLLLVLLIVLNQILIYGQNITSDKKIVSTTETRKAAEIQCRATYGALKLFDIVTYKDIDGERASDVYIFAKSDKWFNKKQELIDSIYYYRKMLHKYADSMRYFNYEENKFNNQEKLSGLRNYTALFCNLSNRSDEFITIFTSASKNHFPILEYREGLPESYIMRYDIEEDLSQKSLLFRNGLEFFYLGILRSYVAESNSNNRTFINLTEPTIILTEKDVNDYLFNLTTVIEENQTQLNNNWDYIESLSLDKINNNQINLKPLAPVVISNVPYFNQWDWTNVLPAKGSCVVMTGASVLSYYDKLGYWNINPFSWYNGPPNTSNAGFVWPPGINYSTNYGGSWGIRELYFGPETMLHQMGQSFGYDFVNGSTSVGCLSATLSGKFSSYTNSRLGLSFSYNQDCVFGGHSYAAIKTEINNNRPMALTGLDYYSWSTSPGPYTQLGYHAVAIVGYDENYWSGNPAIGVYTNGSSGNRSTVYWSYSQIQSQNSEITVASTAGGNPGTFLSAPTINSPPNNGYVQKGSIYFQWNNNAPEFRIQISSSTDFSSYILDRTQVSNNFYTTINDTGTYYWRIVPKNTNGNWCHFSNPANKFTVIDAPPAPIGLTAAPSSWTNVNSFTLLSR